MYNSADKSRKYFTLIIDDLGRDCSFVLAKILFLLSCGDAASFAYSFHFLDQARYLVLYVPLIYSARYLMFRFPILFEPTHNISPLLQASLLLGKAISCLILGNAHWLRSRWPPMMTLDVFLGRHLWYERLPLLITSGNRSKRL